MHRSSTSCRVTFRTANSQHLSQQWISQILYLRYLKQEVKEDFLPNRFDMTGTFRITAFCKTSMNLDFPKCPQSSVYAIRNVSSLLKSHCSCQIHLQLNCHALAVNLYCLTILRMISYNQHKIELLIIQLD